MSKNSVPQRAKFYTKPEVSVQVALRARPLSSDERYLAKSKSIVKFLGGLSNQVEVRTSSQRANRNFTFDMTLDPTVSQERVYISCVLPLVRTFFAGFHATVFAYGATGSGKTHTMGSGINHKLSSRELGIIPRVVADVFRLVQMERAQMLEQGRGDVEHELRISCLEIYQERVQDLLNPDTDPSDIAIRETPSGDTQVLGVGEKRVKSYDEVMAYFERASTLRTTASTLMNAQSSRSHAIYSITLKKKVRAPPSAGDDDDGWEDDGRGRNKKARYVSSSVSKLHLVDLAGSEAVAKSGVSGVQFDEARNINKSLLTLGNVISILGNATGPLPKGTHIPYRASKLTRLLKNSLGGNSRTLMIACISPADLHESDTLNTLQYAARARNIRNKPIMNKEDVMTPEQFKKMKEEMEQLRSQLRNLRDSDDGPHGGGGGGGGGGHARPVNVAPEYFDKIERLLLLEKDLRDRGMGESKAFLEGKMLEILQQSEERYAGEIDALKAHITAMEREIRARRMSKGMSGDAGIGGDADGRVNSTEEDADLQRLQNDVARLRKEHQRLMKQRSRSAADLDTEQHRRNAGQEQQIEQLHANQLRMEAAVRALQESIQQKQEQLVSLSRSMDMRAMEAAQRAGGAGGGAGGVPYGFHVGGQGSVIIEEHEAPEEETDATDDLAEFTRAPRAEFNYFHPRDLPPAYRRVLGRLKLDLVMGELERQFGFQDDSVECQLDHACFLLSNLASHPSVMRERAAGERAGRPHVDDVRPALEAAVSVAHAKLLLNYFQWCQRLRVAPNTSADSAAGPRVREVCLYLLIWGESANVRHMPEALSFLFHHMVREMHGNMNGAARRPGSFLDHVVRPIYKVLQRNRQDGTVQRINYDDVNEFFWSPSCLSADYANPAYFTDCFMDEDELRRLYGKNFDLYMGSYAVQATAVKEGARRGAGAADAKRNEDDDDDSDGDGDIDARGRGALSRRGERHNADKRTAPVRLEKLDSARSIGSRKSEGEVGMPQPKDGGAAEAVSQALPRAPKTFIEKQSFLNPLRSFHRVFFFFAITFQLMASLAYVLDNLTCELSDDADFVDPDPLCGTYRSFEAQRVMLSVAVGAAALSFFKELLDLWALWGIWSTGAASRVAFAIRFLVKAGVLLLLGATYYWSWTDADEWWDSYRSVAVLYLGLHALEIVRQLVPPLNRAVEAVARSAPFRPLTRLFSSTLADSYVGRDVTESSWDTLKYQVFWVLTLAAKMYSSWQFQVRPLVQVTDKLWDADIRSSLLLPSPAPNLILIVIFWIPFVLVYFADTMIWFAVVQAVYGIFVGLARRLGGIHDFGALARRFAEGPALFARKVLWDRHASPAGIVDPSRPRGREFQIVQSAEAETDDVTDAELPVYFARQSTRSVAASRANLLASGDLEAEMGEDEIEAAVAAAEEASNERRLAGKGTSADTAGDWSRLVSAYVQSTEEADGAGGGGGVGGAREGADPAKGGGHADAEAEAAAERAQWTRFALTWNEVVADMRRNDLISNDEERMLQFRFVSDKLGNRIKYYMPLAMTAGSIDALLLELQEFSEEAHDAGPRQKLRLEALLLESLCLPERKIHREAAMELVELTQWLVSVVLGHAHADEIDSVFAFLEDVVLDARLLHVVRLDRLRDFKGKLLALVRGCRKAFVALQLKAEQMKKKLRGRSAANSPLRGRSAAATPRGRSAATTPRGRRRADAALGDVVDEKHDDASSEAVGEMSTSGSAGTFDTAQEMHGLIRAPSADTFAMLDAQRRRQQQLLQQRQHEQAGADADADEPDGLADDVFVDAWDAADASAAVGAAYVNMLRDQLRALLRALGRSVNPNVPGVQSEDAGPGFERADAREGFVNPLNDVLLDADGFFWNDAYAAECVQELLEHRMCEPALDALEASLTLTPLDTQPQSEEAKRRLFFFVNSLAMDMPFAPRVANMVSCSTLTPFYTEDVVYSYNDMVKETPGGVSTFFYLQTIYPHEWANFLQRVGLAGRGIKEGVNLSADEKIIEARLWATRRGQTLYRTVEGMMLYERALRFLSDLEEPGQNREALCQNVLLKYTYVVSCQVYGQQKRTLDPKADDIEYLLMRWPSLRIAYIDYVKVPEYDAEGNLQVREEYYSVLIKAVRLDEDGRPVYGYADPDSGSMFANSDSAYVDRRRYRVQEVYRIRLPGNPLLGEGKPENQCHSIVFTRGEVMQAIDMNQENYFEEAVKLRNLLQEFGRKPHRHPTRIVGFRETVYTAGLSSVAGYMALQELTFATLTQRVLDEPLRVRFHYGHPDLFDKMFCMNNGGVSKPSKSINLNEDVFAGFNTVLRGGAVTMNEYMTVGKGREVGLQQLFKFEAKLGAGAAMQAMSRDIHRVANRFDFFRLMSFFFGGVGFYLGNSLVILALFFFMYSRLLVTAFGATEARDDPGVEAVAYWFGQIGFVLTLPQFASLLLERGLRLAVWDILKMLGTGGPIFFIFNMGTKAHLFEQTLLAGGARYRATGRGFLTKHEKFAELFRFYSFSHFDKALELMMLLIMYAVVFDGTLSYSIVTWPAWLLVASWFFAPFWFNPMAFDWERTLEDAQDFIMWMRRKEHDPGRSWRSWYIEETEYLSELDFMQKLRISLFSLRHMMVGVALIYWRGSSEEEIVLCVCVLLLLYITASVTRSRAGARYMRCVRSLQGAYVLGLLVLAIALPLAFGVSFGEFVRGTVTFVGIVYMMASAVTVLRSFGVRSMFMTRVVQVYDFAIGLFLLVIVGTLAILVVPAYIQTRLMFYNAFSRGVMISRLLHGSTERASAVLDTPTNYELDQNAPDKKPALRAVKKSD